MNKKSIIFKITIFLTALAILALSPTLIYAKMTKKVEFSGKEYGALLRLWHIDSFEGGKGSRGQFLQARASEFERKNSGTLILVTTHTEYSAAEAFARGDFPDMLSFGAGFSEHIGQVKPFLNTNFDAGKFSGHTYALPWCYGAYGVYSLKKQIDLENLQNKIAVNSQGGLAALAFSNIKLNNFEVIQPMQAYVGLLNGNYDYLIGTQRDCARFIARGVQVNFAPLSSFSDLFQYISILSDDTQKIDASRLFISYLTSSPSQEKVSSISMLSLNNFIYNFENPIMQMMEINPPKLTIPAFIAQAQLSEFYALCEKAVKGDDIANKKIRNFAINI